MVPFAAAPPAGLRVDPAAALCVDAGAGFCDRPMPGCTGLPRTARPRERRTPVGIRGGEFSSVRGCVT